MAKQKWLEMVWWEPNKGILEFYAGEWLVEIQWLKVTITKPLRRYRSWRGWK